MKNRITIGIDEVGRGALAGPLVVAAVSVRGAVRWNHPTLGCIRDSKKLTPRMREVWFQHLTMHPALSWHIARVGPVVIDRINISRAADCGALRLVRRMQQSAVVRCVLLDGGLRLPQSVPHRAIIRGDERVPIIAAASIIAKVLRDRYMVRLDSLFPAYGFSAHKGYGTAYHRERIRKFGSAVVHRRSFLTRIMRAPV